MQMLTIQSHRPGGGARLGLHVVVVELGVLAVGRSRVTTCRAQRLLVLELLGRLSLSKRVSVSRNLAGSAIIFLAPPHDRSSFLRLAPLGASMYCTAAVTLSTAAGRRRRGLELAERRLVEAVERGLRLLDRGLGGGEVGVALRLEGADTSSCTLATFSSSTAAFSACSSAIGRLLPHLLEQRVRLLLLLLDDDRSPP